MVVCIAKWCALSLILIFLAETIRQNKRFLNFFLASTKYILTGLHNYQKCLHVYTLSERCYAHTDMECTFHLNLMKHIHCDFV